MTGTTSASPPRKQDGGADIDLVLRCRELNDVASKVREALQGRMAELAKDDLVYTFKSRVKSASSILSKVRRKRAEEERSPPASGKGYGADNVTDAWGCRYVTLYQSQIPPTVRELLADFDRYNESTDRKVSMVEFVIYTNRPPKDPLSITQETMHALRSCKISSGVGSEDSIREPENRKSAYSSVHLLFAVEVEVEHPGRGVVTETAKFEVQVRDIFEEGWGEIQHNLIYSGKDRQRPADAGDDYDPLWQPHLNALKTFVDGCSQHASIIKKTYDFIRLKSMPSFETKSATSRPTDRDAIIKAIEDQAAPNAIGLVRLGYSLIIEAQKAGSVEEARASYRTAAIKFSEAIAQLAGFLDRRVPERFDRTVGYFLRIEKANCLYLSHDGAAAEAVSIYRDLLACTSDDPTVRYRLAIALASLRKEDPAALREAIGLIEESIRLIDQDPLTGPQHWIAVSCRVRLGYFAWCLSEIATDVAAKLRDLRRAVAETQAGHEIWKGLDETRKSEEFNLLSAHKALSNLLYYAAKFVGLHPDDAEIDKAFIKRCIDDLESLEVPPYLEYYKTRDNIMHALVAIGDKATARQVARDNASDLRKRAEARANRPLAATDVSTYMLEDERRNYATAVAVIADPDG